MTFYYMKTLLQRDGKVDPMKSTLLLHSHLNDILKLPSLGSFFA